MIDVCLLRKGMIAELETVNEYRKLQSQCIDETTKKLFESIIQEEIVHAGEFQYAIERLCTMSKDKTEEGKREAEGIIASAPMISMH